MLVCTCDEIPGYRVKTCLGLVRGNAVRSKHIGLDVLAIIYNIVGGEISDYTKMMAETREQALDRMQEEARQIGANAIVSVRFASAEIMRGAAELLCYGTAMIVEHENSAMNELLCES